MSYTYEYPRPAVTTDCVAFSFDKTAGLSVLLIKRANDPFKDCWAFPGGFLNMDEDAETGARRELYEETGLEVEHLEEFGTFSRVDRDTRGRVITIAHLALVQMTDVEGDDDAAEACWFPLGQLPQLAFDHAEILEKALKTLKEQIYFQPVVFEMLPEIFTMPQIHYLYETILGVRFDRRNFASKMLKSGILEVFGDGLERRGTRNPIKYRFDEEKYDLLKSRGFRQEF